MVKKAVQRGRNEQRGEAYFELYIEPLSDVRTKLAGFFTILHGGAREGVDDRCSRRRFGSG